MFCLVFWLPWRRGDTGENNPGCWGKWSEGARGTVAGFQRPRDTHPSIGGQDPSSGAERSWRRSKLQSQDKSYYPELRSSGWAGHDPQFAKFHTQLDTYTGLTGIYSSTEEQRNWHWEGLRPIYFDVSIDFKIVVAVTPGALSLQFDSSKLWITNLKELL